ncbi:MAG TPA: adenylate kinase [Lentisphaeria bacterium]|nr:MAG: adenylate kinase [Lentisphaerae bacterium GWF2_38_69]HBM15270.1 adenylate kinase [Lentisphaeria bacterium]
MKLHIFGASGSGVTTLGQAIANRLDVPYFDSDNYFWKNTEQPFTERYNAEERNLRIIADLEKHDDWILGGSVINWGDHVFPTFDLIVFLYLPKEIRIERLKKREFERYGDQLCSDQKKLKKFENFINWASDYDDNSGIANRTLHAHEKWIAKANTKILKLVGDLTIEEKMKQILEILNEEKLLPARIKQI